MAKQPLFPFYISDATAHRLAKQDTDFSAKLEREARFQNITQLTVTGEIGADKTLYLHGWMATDNGFCQTAGRFWDKTIVLDSDRFDSFVDAEITKRAVAEIQAEEDAKLEVRITARAAELRAKLLKD
jgi:type II secretory pathway predicted ATPase ExeA